ncbi:hypothetical protein LMG29542_02304 [Paraburkholderia humisilvae]|uniref:Transmembrane protein n=1 Tax=Paraburkholderia humisilvae TaxID=627669 RepID=A0A6J5DJ76_9BURK|nr:hypothetical protein LMG29542_02304 [Paraburkholderia humisilvae]
MKNESDGRRQREESPGPFGLHHTSRRFVGYSIFGAIACAALLFCLWFKHRFWNEALGVDGIILWFAIVLIVLGPIRIGLRRLMESGFDRKR